MASKSAQYDAEKPEDVETLLDALEVALDRVKALYEQYFLGLQKQPPTHLHTDVERKLRELSQLHIRNTALRYRLATTQQKFGSYNNYWRRTLRQIESGTYHRNLSKISRQAARSGAEIPEEILAAMPQRMRDQVRRDREAALALARLREKPAGVLPGGEISDDDLLTLAPLPGDGVPAEAVDDDEPGFVQESTETRRSLLQRGNAPPARPQVHEIEDDGDIDFDKFFAGLEDNSDEPPAPRAAVRPVVPPPRPGTGLRTANAAPTVTSAIRSILDTPGPNALGLDKATPGAAGAAGTQRLWGERRAMPPIPSAPSQVSRPNPVIPGSSVARPAVPVETLSGPFPRARTEPGAAPSPPRRPTISPPIPPPTAASAPTQRAAPPPLRAAPPPRPPPPAGMSEADVNALYATYVKAKQMVGEETGPGSYGKLLKTINAQAPKIMEQYGAKGVAFSVVVKDNQVVIRAKPKP